ncbi:MAG TPA: hypothetical protein VL742_15870 [Casimicrobiaceae bacterium]|nr:hypothetical protein [Casimicrobiaceae bacterium]
MKKLVIALCAGAFALGSVTALAQIPQGDKTPPQPVNEKQLKEERMKAKAEKAKMTAEEKKAARAKKQKQTSEAASQGDTGNKMEQQKEEKAAAAASKMQPKALPTKEAKQKALKEQEKQGGQ